MKDPIERQDAIDALCNDYCGGHQDCKYYPKCENLKSIQKLPSAQPERPKGKWMPHREICREYIGTVLVNVDYDYWLCDTCGYRVKKDSQRIIFARTAVLI